MTVLNNRQTDISEKFSNFIELLHYRAQHQPESTAYTFLQYGETENTDLTYQQLEQQARAIAGVLTSLNASGSRALLLYSPGQEYITAFFGCLYASVVAVPAYPLRRNQNTARLLSILANSEAQIGLTTTSLLKDIERRFEENPELSKLQWITTDNIASNLTQTWKQPEIESNTLAFLQYTSGSTGTPKGVMVSHANLLHNSALIHQCFGHTPNSQGVIWLPPYHDMGLIGGILQPLYGGFPVALMSPVDFLQKPLRWLQAVSRYKATTSGGPNFAYELCLDKITPEQRSSLDLSSWEVAFTGAEPIRAETLERFYEAFSSCGFRKEAFYPCYGMAETTLIVSGGLKSEPPVIQQVDAVALERNKVVTSIKGDNDFRTVVGCGTCLLDHTIAIVNPESRTQCPKGQIGEIWVSGPSVAGGYWNQIEETEQSFCAYLEDTGIGPFLRTGDLGFLLDGELFITGRIKDIIILKGQNHYPQDIEFTVEKSHPALRPNSGAAFAVDIKNSEQLVIVQEVERSYLRNLNLNEVVKDIQQAVTAEHGLMVYSTVLVKTGSIPKTSSGKIRRQACRAAFLTGSLDVVGDWSENPQGRTKFLNLQAEVESLLEKLSTGTES